MLSHVLAVHVILVTLGLVATGAIRNLRITASAGAGFGPRDGIQLRIAGSSVPPERRPNRQSHRRHRGYQDVS